MTMRTRLPLLVASLLATVAVTGCATTATDVPVVAGPEPLRLNADYQAGAVYDPSAPPLPSLEQLVNRVPSPARAPNGKVDVLRGPAMREGAMAYGAKAGLAWETRANNLALNSRAGEFGRIYNFDRVLIEAPGHAKIAPPVISKAEEAWETSDAGRTLRVADNVYRIVEQARFVPVAPAWQTYLVRSYSAPEVPNDVLLPQSADERARWGEWVKEGWEMGREQAREILKLDLARLDRDFNGMLRYKVLLEEGKVSPPTVADSQLGTTGSGEDMRVNDRAVTITQDPKLQVTSPGDWRATPTAPGPGGFPTGNGPVAAPAPAAPVNTVAPSTPVARVETRTEVAVVHAPKPASPSAAPKEREDEGSRRAW